jgi:hypothetical protein
MWAKFGCSINKKQHSSLLGKWDSNSTINDVFFESLRKN